MPKKIICLILSILFAIISMNVIAENTNPEIPQTRYSYIWDVASGLTISGTTAACYGKGRGMYTDTTTHLLVRLAQKSPDGGPWTVIDSWTTTASGTGTAILRETTTVSTGYSYRVVVRCQIKDSNGTVLETAYCYSPVWTI